MNASRKLGYIGLGAMGMGMAQNLLRAGHDLTVYDVRADVTAVLVEEGAHAAATPAELGAACDVVHVNVRTEEQVEEVLFGIGGDGGAGGNGGAGGAGGGGGGGPSIGILSTGTAPTLSNNIFVIGAGGVGGAGFFAGVTGRSGNVVNLP